MANGNAKSTNGIDNSAVVYVVDDDAHFGRAMGFLLDSVGMKNEIFQSAEAFLDGYSADRHSCLVLDVRMPGLGGFGLHDRLKDENVTLPIMFITGHADVQMAVDAMRNGAFDFMEKPVRDQAILDRINEALEISKQRQIEWQQRTEISKHWKALTKREVDVANLVVRGKPNKIIAFELGVSQRTVEIHRGRVMKKMQADSLADLIRMRTQLDQA